MTNARHDSQPPSTAAIDRYDAIIIGAGIAGMYQLYRLRQLGLAVRVFEAGAGVGGTWYWNRYPGARFDSESYSYGYAFDETLLQEWDWSEHFSPQPETLRYLEFVADRFELQKDIEFDRPVTAATFDETESVWTIETENGRRARARFLITAVGILSAPTWPDIEGIESFEGAAYHTARWPHEPVDFTGKRVGVIGTGATGVQVIQEVAKTARPSHGLPANAELLCPAGQPSDRRRDPAHDQGELPRDLRQVPRDLRRLPAPVRPALGPRGAAGRARGVLGGSLLGARLRHLVGQFQRHPDQQGGERPPQRVHAQEDPRARSEPRGGGKAVPEEPRLRHPARAARDRLLRSLQPGQRRAGRSARDSHRAHHREGHPDHEGRA